MRLSRGCLALSLCVGLAGCDVARGFQNAGQSLVPDQKSYLELGGTRLLAGSFHDVQLGIAPRVGAYLTARPGKADSGSRALALIDVQNQSVCQVANAAAYDADFARRMLPSLSIGYLEASDDSGTGTLRFVDPHCSPHDPSVPDASWPPLDATARSGFAVRAGGGLAFADVVTGTARTLLGSFQAAYPIATVLDDGSYLVQWVTQGDGQVVLFDADWNEQARYGNGVDGLAIPNGFSSPNFTGYYTDVDGLHRVELYPATLDKDVDELIERGACRVHPGFRQQDLLADFEGVVYYSPCDDPALVVRSGDVRYQYAASAEPELVRVMLGSSSLPMLAFIKDVVPGTRRGSLVVATPLSASASQPVDPLAPLYQPVPLGAEFPVADDVELDWVQRANGMLALAESDGNQGALIRFDLSIAEQPDAPPLTGPDFLAERVLTASDAAEPGHVYPDLEYDAMLSNASDTTADLTMLCQTSCAMPTITAQRVPIHGFLARHDEYFKTDVPARWQALLLTDFDGSGGTLRLAQYWRDDASTMPVVANGVAPGKFTLLDSIPLPGAAFLTHYDATAGSGRLEYANVDLGFQQTIHEGVSELVTVLWPEASLLFVVPDGPDAGIWLSLAK